MPGRQLSVDARTAFEGEVDISFSFVLNGTGAITIANPVAGALPANILYRGGGLLPGGSVVYAGATGTYTVTLGIGHNYRYIVFKSAELDDTPNDGAYATCGGALNEGTALPLAFTLYTRAAAGAATTYTGRRCQVLVTVKQGGAGA